LKTASTVPDKVSKAEAGYVCTPGCNYLCGECQFRKGESQCAFFGPAAGISFTEGSCNAWKSGDPKGVPWLKPYYGFAELGYAENKNGFGCKRCEHFGAGKNDCEKVDRKSPGLTPGIISAEACCDFQKPDKERAQMTDGKLVQILKASPGDRVLRFR
jgi:hypothetical protein